METFKYVWETEPIRYIALGIIGLAIIVFIILLGIHLSKSRKGEYSKFLWFETRNSTNGKEKTQKVQGKNVNTGNNFGKIGDN